MLSQVVKASSIKQGLPWDEQKEKSFKKSIVEKYDTESHALYGSARLWDDGVIMPEDTRTVLGLSL